MHIYNMGLGRESLSFGFLTWSYPNQSAQLHRIARQVKFLLEASLVILSNINIVWAAAQAGLVLCCSQTPKTGFLVSRPIDCTHMGL